jgi:hypothetical protein
MGARDPLSPVAWCYTFARGNGKLAEIPDCFLHQRCQMNAGELKTSAVSFLIGALSSLTASYVYSWLTGIQLNSYVTLSVVFIIGLIFVVVFQYLPAIRLLYKSEVNGYFPNGQNQYMPYVIRDLGRSRSLLLIGARAQDLVGERSPIGSFLTKGNWSGAIEVYILDPQSPHMRLRPGSLQADIEKYQAECRALSSFLDTLYVHHINAQKFTYHTEPKIRAIILDHAGYICFYEAGRQGRQLPCYRLRLDKGGILDKMLHSYTLYLGTTAPPIMQPLSTEISYQPLPPLR